MRNLVEWLWMLVLLCGSAWIAQDARAAVYRCVAAGGAVWTDRPCGAGAAPANLPPLDHVPAMPGIDLLAEYESREARSRARLSAAPAPRVGARASPKPTGVEVRQKAQPKKARKSGAGETSAAEARIMAPRKAPHAPAARASRGKAARDGPAWRGRSPDPEQR